MKTLTAKDIYLNYYCLKPVEELLKEEIRIKLLSIITKDCKNINYRVRLKDLSEDFILSYIVYYSNLSSEEKELPMDVDISEIIKEEIDKGFIAATGYVKDQPGNVLERDFMREEINLNNSEV